MRVSACRAHGARPSHSTDRRSRTSSRAGSRCHHRCRSHSASCRLARLQTGLPAVVRAVGRPSRWRMPLWCGLLAVLLPVSGLAHCACRMWNFSNMVAVVQTRATTSTRSRSTAQHKAPPVPAKAADALVEEPKKTPAVQAAPPAETQQPAPASAQAMDNAQPTSAAAPMHPLSVEPADVPACMGMMGIADVSQLRAWAVMNGLGPAVPMTSPQAQAHAVASLAAHSQQLALMQLQMHTGFGAGAVLPAAAAALSSPVRPVTRSFAGFQLNSVVPQTS